MRRSQMYSCTEKQHRPQTLPSLNGRCSLFILLLLSASAYGVSGMDASMEWTEGGRQSIKDQTNKVQKVGIINHESLFFTISKSLFGKRDTQSLSNNEPAQEIISPGETQQFVFPSTQLFGPTSTDAPTIPLSMVDLTTEEQDIVHAELKRRQKSAPTLYLSLSICNQPSPSNANVNGPPAGLDLYISSPGRTDPGPTSSDPGIRPLSTTEGFVVHVNEFSEDVNFAVYAPPISGYTGTYSYEVTASIDQLYSNYMDFPSLYLIDRDNEAGMFITTNLTNSTNRDDERVNDWLSRPPSFSIFVNQQDDYQITGLKRSYCGLKNNAQIKGNVPGINSSVDVGMTNLGDITAKQQFHVPGLNASSSYFAVLGLPSNYTGTGPGVPTGGGMVWQSIDFSTNAEGSCQVIYNLSFCSSVSYAVPSNGSVNVHDLGAQYDNYAQSLYLNFSYSLQQIACNTEPEAQYSLATNCSECDTAYQAWLCAVTIPRCSTSNETYKLTRPFNQSRNPMVNSEIRPNTYFEIPPCGDICFGLVQKCPASLGFACPYAQSWYYNESYGYPGGNASDPTCNIPGAIWGVSGAASLRPSTIVIVFFTALLFMALN